jgi:hypothetical protein
MQLRRKHADSPHQPLDRTTSDAEMIVGDQDVVKLNHNDLPRFRREKTAVVPEFIPALHGDGERGTTWRCRACRAKRRERSMDRTRGAEGYEDNCRSVVWRNAAACGPGPGAVNDTPVC